MIIVVINPTNCAQGAALHYYTQQTHHLPSSGTGARGTLGQGRVGLTLNIQLQTPAFNIENVSIVGISGIFVSLASVLDWARSYF